MLVNLQEVLKYADSHECAIGAFNTPTLESLKAVLDAAEDYNVPVIIAHAEVHDPEAPLDVIGPIMVEMAKRSRVPVVVHLDHGTDIGYIEKALKLGFTSCMYDGSLLPYEENLRNTVKAVQLARNYNAGIEAEIGVIGGRLPDNLLNAKPEDLYTRPNEAKDFVEKTGIDALACGFGTAHGVYKIQPRLSFSTITKCKEATGGVPIVMHGGSGVSPEDYVKAIKAGVRKINYYTYMAKAGVEEARHYLNTHPDCVYYHELAADVTKAMEEDVKKAMRVFYGLNKE